MSSAARKPPLPTDQHQNSVDDVECLQFPSALKRDPNFPNSPEIALHHASLETNTLLRSSHVDDTVSGTTLVAAALVGTQLHVADVGDSRAVLAVYTNGQLVAKDMSWDQTPMRSDECERVKACGARVLSGKQVRGFQDQAIQHWTSQVCLFTICSRCLRLV